MLFDASTASSLLSALALLFVSKGNHYNGAQTQTATTDVPLAFQPRTKRTTFRPTFTSLRNDRNKNANDLMVPRRVNQEKYVALLDWLKSNGAIVSDCLKINLSSQGEQAGYGVFVDKKVEEGELLFSIPRNLCVTIDKATLSSDDDGTFGKGLSELIEKAGPGGSTVAIAGYMAKEYILMYLDEMDKETGSDNSSSSINQTNKNDRWGPYMELMPWKRGTNNQEHVLFWNEAKIEGLLRGSLCYSEARSLRQEVAFSIQVLGPLLKRSVRMARGDLSTDPLKRLTSMLPWQQYTKPPQDYDLNDILDDKLIGDAIKGAFVTLLTRSFTDDDDDEKVSGDNSDDDADSEKLVPLLDLLQHSDTPNVRHRVVGGSGNGSRVEVRARRTIDPGSELWNQYRSEEDEDMPYSRFFTRFGFVPGIDEPIENLLLDKSPIFYPQKAEV